MAFKHGRFTTVMLGSVDLSPYLTTADTTAELDAADAATFGKTWRSVVVGVAGYNLETAGYYDPAETSLPTLFNTYVPGVITICPGGGATIGDGARLAAPLSVSYTESAPVGGIVAISASFMGTGIVGFGDVLHPLGEDTNTTVGSSKNDGAATSTGWTAHLHVTVVDGGSWVVKLEDSANNSDWADVTGGAFTAATGATSERLRGAADTTTLRRYVRYTATRTGGSAGDGITFFLAYSRGS